MGARKSKLAAKKVAHGSVTYFVVLPFIRETDTGELIAQEGQEVPREHSAMTRARAMVDLRRARLPFGAPVTRPRRF